MWYRFSQNPKEYDILGAKHKGPFFDTLKELGVTHENYKFKSIAPTDFVDKNDEKLIGHGSDRRVYFDPITGKVKKYPIPSQGTSFYDGVRTRISDLDNLILTFERVMELRIFARVINEYNDYYFKMHPEKANELAHVVVPEYDIDKDAIIYEDLMPEESRALGNKFIHELFLHMPLVVKNLAKFDFRGANHFHVGNLENKNPKYNRPKYQIVDGAEFPKIKDIDSAVWHGERYLLNTFGYGNETARPPAYGTPKDWEGTEQIREDLEKYNEIVTRISEEELQLAISKIRSLFKDWKT